MLISTPTRNSTTQPHPNSQPTQPEPTHATPHAVIGVCVLAIGFGIGFGVGWGAWGAENGSGGASCPTSVTVTPDGSSGADVDLIRPYEPLSAAVIRGGNAPGGGSPEALLRRKAATEAVMGPAFQVGAREAGAGMGWGTPRARWESEAGGGGMAAWHRVQRVP